MKIQKSRWPLIASICAIALLSAAAIPAAQAKDDVNTFAVLPDGASGPEGITVGPDRNVYVSTFGFTATGPAAAPGKVYVFSKNGKLLRTLMVSGSSANLLGLAFHPTTGDLLVIDNGNSKVLKVNPTNGAATTFMTVTGAAGLNALTFDDAGNVYVSDSFQGIIWKTGSAGGAGTPWVTDDLLKTTGVPPFGANGLAFNNAEDALLVANTGNDQIIKIPVTGGTPGTPAVFVNSINGADGLIIDGDDNIWVAANQSDEIVVLDPTGKLITKLGDFDGVKNGTPRGLLFPASLTFDTHSGRSHGGGGRPHELLVTNLALDLRLFGLAQSPDSQWAAEVTHYTISRIEIGKFKN